ncbi:phosphoribosyltransferase [Longibacter sp.]|jgi:putative phosphoribosyl transferase|uniref:phosphoribosyltransferase n=1 Tax=Longibacter sp. TaxID=2045415 RepID=UPI003EC0436C
MQPTFRYTDRQEAGRHLTRHLARFESRDPLVLALPRGGVPVAFEVARALRAPLDVWVARKLGIPQQPELGFGAISSGDVTVIDEATIRATGLSSTDIQAVVSREREELRRRTDRYRSNRTDPADRVPGRHVIVVDDGLATGLTAEAALRSIRGRQPASITLAVPVAASDSARRIKEVADAFVCPLETDDLVAIGVWYRRFPQLSDEDVLALLEKAARSRHARSPRDEVFPDRSFDSSHPSRRDA